MDKLKSLIDEWGKDLLAGLSFSGLSSWLKYAFQHFVDIGWTVTAALAVMIANHCGKKYLIPWISKKFKI